MATQGLGLGLDITELRLGLPCMGSKNETAGLKSTEKKRAFWETVEENGSKKTINDDKLKCTKLSGSNNNEGVVGWPPVCSYRKKNTFNGNSSKMYVKVSMDGAPILRKIDLGCFTDYSHLITALHQNLFHSFNNHANIGEDDEYVPIYEDRDGDWMLVGDVPWEMFTETCKRLRIMKGADATGIGLHLKS